MKTIIKRTYNTSQDVQIAQFIESSCPDVQGHIRKVTRGGVLHSASVEWRNIPVDFDWCIVCFIDVVATPSQLEFTLTFTGWVAELDPDDKRYYTWGADSYIGNVHSFDEASRNIQRAILRRAS